ncbi:MAG: hypothetical protein WC089_00675 [Candidatus Paceibacterota bacterium]
MKNSKTSILVGLAILFCHEIYKFHIKFNSGFTMEFLNASAYIFLPALLFFLMSKVVLPSKKKEAFSEFFDFIWFISAILSLGVLFKSLLLSFNIHPGILINSVIWVTSFFTVTILYLKSHKDDDQEKKRKEIEAKRIEHGIFS